MDLFVLSLGQNNAVVYSNMHLSTCDIRHA